MNLDAARSGAHGEADRRPSDLPVACIVGFSPGACRLLDEAGVPVVIVDEHPPPSCRRHIHRSFVCARYSPPPADAAFEQQLCDVARAIGTLHRPVLLPASDAALLAIGAAHERLASAFTIASASPSIAKLAVNKVRFAEWAVANDVPVPPGRVVRTRDALPTALDDLPLPAIVKPEYTFVLEALEGRKLFHARTHDEARRGAETCLHHGMQVVLQTDLSRDRSIQWSLAGFADQGEIRQAILAEKLRQVAWGAGTAVETRPMDPAVLDVGRTLCRALHLEGLFEIELRPDLDGAPTVIEINTRLWSQVRLPRAAGMDLLGAAYQHAIGAPVELESAYRAGVGWLSWRRDVRVAFRMLIAHELRLASLARSLAHVRVAD